MCHHITATVPEQANLGELARLFDECKLGFEIIENIHLREQLPPRTHYLLTTRGTCDCGTALGSCRPDDGAKPRSFEVEAGKLRKRGWSEAKIARWLEEKDKAREKELLRAQQTGESAISGAEEWLATINRILRSGMTSQIGILLHWYDGSVTSERIKLKRTIRLVTATVTPQDLLELEEDVLYTFVLD